MKIGKIEIIIIVLIGLVGLMQPVSAGDTDQKQAVVNTSIVGHIFMDTDFTDPKIIINYMGIGPIDIDSFDSGTAESDSFNLEIASNFATWNVAVNMSSGFATNSPLNITVSGDLAKVMAVPLNPLPLVTDSGGKYDCDVKFWLGKSWKNAAGDYETTVTLVGSSGA